jgi:hypothetical protein
MIVAIPDMVTKTEYFIAYAVVAFCGFMLGWIIATVRERRRRDLTADEAYLRARGDVQSGAEPSHKPGLK